MKDSRVQSAAIIDVSIVDRMISDLDADTVAECIHVFIGEMRDRVRRIGRARLIDDWPTVRAEAHTLKASSATYGAVRMAVVSGAIEEACHRGDLTEIAGLAADLPQLASETARALERIIAA